jgi:hypothetical protein
MELVCTSQQWDTGTNFAHLAVLQETRLFERKTSRQARWLPYRWMHINGQIQECINTEVGRLTDRWLDGWMDAQKRTD